MAESNTFNILLEVTEEQHNAIEAFFVHNNWELNCQRQGKNNFLIN